MAVYTTKSKAKKMEKFRWGLCCLFKNIPIKYRSTTVAYIQRLKTKEQNPFEFLDKIVIANLEAL